MRRAFTTLGLLLAVGAMAVLWRALLQGGDLPAPARDGGVPVAVPPPTTTAPDGSQPDSNRPGSNAASEEPQVWIEVETLARLRPPPGASIVVVRQGQVVAALCEVIAGDLDSTNRPDARAGLPLVAARVGAALYHRRAERRDDGVLGIELGFERSLRGRVVDVRAQPVALAQVWFGGDATQVLATDDDGRFEVLVPAGAGVPVLVRGKGMADKCTFAHVSADGGADVTIVLAEGAAVSVQAQGRADLLRDTAVHVVPADHAHTEALSYPWFGPAVFGATQLDTDGRAIVTGLPVGATVAVAIAGPACRCVRSADVVVRRAGAVATVAVDAAVLLHGELVDEQGDPVVGALVYCGPAGQSPHAAARISALLPVATAAPGVAVATTDANGAFALARPPAGAATLQAVHAGGAVEAEVAADVTRPRLLLPAIVAEARLQVAPPVPARPWWLRCDFPVGSFAAQPADVPAVLWLTPGIVTLRVRVGSGDAFGPAREQRAFVLNGDIALPAALLQR